MRLLLDTGTWGMRLMKDKDEYILKRDDPAAPVVYTISYKEKEDAITDIVGYIMDPTNVYAMDEQPEELQEAFKLISFPFSPIADEKTRAAATLLMYVLDGIIYAKEEEV